MIKSTLALTEEQIQFFGENGYLRLEQISPPDEVEFVKKVYDRLFAERAGRHQGAYFDAVSSDEDDEKPHTSPQLIDPVLFAPELKKTVFRANALAIAKQLLGVGAYGSFEHAILKPPGIGAPTPWHQDEAFRLDYARGYDEISIWMPLQPVDTSSGCLEFLPASHRLRVLRHASPGNDPRIHALACVDDFDAARAVACPLPAGGCTIHHARTLHHAGPNTSPNPRRAYILGFALPVKSDYKFAQPFPWNMEKQTASDERKRTWRKNGGFAVEFLRKIRKKVTKLTHSA
jgi:ectoine hydroxylase-related dioxygenase (phytanoyl-CoA dioxygenase family)